MTHFTPNCKPERCSHAWQSTTMSIRLQLVFHCVTNTWNVQRRVVDW